jgi:pimeloyl-ACP methyl ester carboxylesterase
MHAKLTATASGSVRIRRAYFDFEFGQLHVRTAFPDTGGFDEQVTLICLHPEHSSSRIFDRFLPAIAGVRSVYAPDLPGEGESDSAPHSNAAAAAGAILDLAATLRLRQIDVLGVQGAAGIALDLAASRPDLVRRLVLVGAGTTAALPRVTQAALVVRTGQEPRESADVWLELKAALPTGTFVDAPDSSEDVFAAPMALARQIGAFLSAA